MFQCWKDDVMTGRYYCSYEVGGCEVLVSSNSKQWFNCIREQVTAAETGGSGEPLAWLELLEAETAEVDRLIPLPGEEYIKQEVSVDWCGGALFRAYVWERKRLHDFAGYGRLYMDFTGRRATAVRILDSDINPRYADVVLALSPLAGLLLGLGLYEVHASCVSVNGRGIMFTGHSGRGKSSAAYALARSGHPLLTDEKVLLTKRGAYYGFVLTDMIKISAGAVSAFFPELQNVPPLFAMGEDLCFKAGRIPGVKHVPAIKVNALFTIERTGRAESRVEKINPARVVGELFPVTMRGFEAENNLTKFEFLMDFLDSVDCYRVCFGTDMDVFARKIEETAGELS
jgi:hypothetical protein